MQISNQEIINKKIIEKEILKQELRLVESALQELKIEDFPTLTVKQFDMMKKGYKNRRPEILSHLNKLNIIIKGLTEKIERGVIYPDR